MTKNVLDREARYGVWEGLLLFMSVNCKEQKRDQEDTSWSSSAEFSKDFTLWRLLFYLFSKPSRLEHLPSVRRRWSSTWWYLLLATGGSRMCQAYKYQKNKPCMPQMEHDQQSHSKSLTGMIFYCIACTSDIWNSNQAWKWGLGLQSNLVSSYSMWIGKGFKISRLHSNESSEIEK